MARSLNRKESIELARGLVLAVAGKLQNDPDPSDETLDDLQEDLRLAARTLADVIDYDALHGEDR